MTNNELKEYLIFFKNKKVDLSNEEIFNEMHTLFGRDIFLKNLEKFEYENLVVENDDRVSYSLTEKGNSKLDELLSKIEYESEKERIDFEKSKVDLELAKETLKEFPRTKWFARIGFFISILLLAKEIYTLLNKQ